MNSSCRRMKETDKIGTPEEIAKALHFHLDWIRACDSRPNNNRGVDVEKMLTRIQEGYELTKNFEEHYNGE